MIKQIKDLNAATLDDLNDNCQFIIDDSNDKTKKVSFNVLKQKIGSGGEVSGLFMGAPDWDKLTEDAKIFDKILVNNTEEQFESTGDGFLVVRCDDLNGQGLYYSQGLYVSKNGIQIIGFPVFGDEADNVNIYASFIPCSKGDKFVIGNSRIFSIGDKIPIHAYVYFVPNKKIQIDVSDVVTPQIAMPDYKATPITANNGWTATENGWLRIAYGGNLSGTASAYVQIDGVTVSHATHVRNTTNTNTDGIIVPIGKNSVVTIVANSGFVVQCDFYPCKAVPQKSDKEEILSLIYPVGSIYFDGSNGEVCPLTSVITGSEWQKIGNKLLTDGSTAPVVGNGKTLCLTDGTNNYGYMTKQSATDILRATNVNAGVGLGVSTDPSYSGLVANLGDVTGITVAIWERTK